MTPEKRVDLLRKKEEQLVELKARIDSFIISTKASTRIWNCHGVEFICGPQIRSPEGSDSLEDYESLKQLLGVAEEDMIYAPIQSGGHMVSTNIKGVYLLALFHKETIFSKGIETGNPYSTFKPVREGTSFDHSAYLVRINHIPSKKAPKQWLMSEWNAMWLVISGKVPEPNVVSRIIYSIKHRLPPRKKG